MAIDVSVELLLTEKSLFAFLTFVHLFHMSTLSTMLLVGYHSSKL